MLSENVIDRYSDLKPANVLLDDGSNAKVADSGTAKLLVPVASGTGKDKNRHTVSILLLLYIQRYKERELIVTCLLLPLFRSPNFQQSLLIHFKNKTFTANSKNKIKDANTKNKVTWLIM